MEDYDGILELFPEYFNVFRGSIQKEVDVHIVGIFLGNTILFDKSRSIL